MTVVIRSVRDIYTLLRTEEDARCFLETLLWPEGRLCPHCGSAESTALRGSSVRPGLYQCRQRACRRQFTVTTRTPMHATKLELRTWILAFFLVLNASKGISSVVLARHLGITQKAAWRIGHAIRELMASEGASSERLTGIVEVDEAFVGGAPKYRKGVKNKRGRGTKKQIVLVAATRTGQARAARVPSGRAVDIRPVLNRWTDPSSTTLMSDRGSTFRAIGRGYQAHHAVKHSAKQFVNTATGAHINTVEAFSGYVERARVGVWHRLTGAHVQRYLNELCWRWNRRQSSTRITANGGRHIVWKPLPLMDLMRELLSNAVGRQIRRSSTYGFRVT